MSRTDGRSAVCRPFPRVRRARALDLSAALALIGCAAAGCANIEASNASDEHATGAAQTSTATTVTNPSGDPGCVAALKAISTYGPSSVKLLAEGREAVNNAGVQLLVTALDGAADAADQPAIKQDIRTLASAYDDYFDLTNDAVAVPVSVVLKDTVDLEGLCRE
ncbi:hypothetical protein KDL01_34430 [Actinospica durhamensis]|uniref:Lipoprotein n=1 Tax=Actinospica durhamensis TaxID=1508375 RepID=A0A941EY02_9ACTN|nr:hypothetical protein [Actinospica durhamensis]MBR7838417.1 hypothetical protein [Actinospica durhamensis]